MTYNIHVGVGMDKKLDLQRIADVINAERPDLVGLQEVDRGVKRTEGKDEIAELAKLTSNALCLRAQSRLSGRSIWRGDSFALSDQTSRSPQI